jgi:nucleotide-binding universal stress UspA family protein
MSEDHRQMRLEPSARRPLGRVLVGVSLLQDAENVLGVAVAIARASGARLTAVHIEEPAGSIDEFAAVMRGDRAQELERRLGRLMEPHAEPITGAAADLRVVTGGMPAHRALIDQAGQLSPDLLVVGATTREGKLLGSTAERVARKAWCPVLVVRSPLELPLRRVVAPVDLSLLSGDGFRCGLELVASLSGGQEAWVLALFAIGYLDPLATRMRQEGLSTEQLTELARGKLDAFVADHLPEAALAVERRAVLGPAREEILRAAAEEHADLVVMATHGRGGFERLLLGSVAATVAREARCSVLLVPPRAALGDAIGEAVLTQTAP